MEMTKSGTLFGVFLTFFISPFVFAQSVVTSEFEMLLPRLFQQSLIDESWRSL